jgi:hypothetical protein
MPLLIYGGSALLVAFGYAADKTGEGVNDASNGAIKLAIAGAIGFYIAKKQGWL